MATALLAFALFAARAQAAPPIFESNVGAPITTPPPPGGITDADDAATTIPMGTFSFPFYGVTHTGPETFGVSSNGLIQFGPGNPSNNPDGNDARLGAPKIAALWADFNPKVVPPPDGLGDGGTVSENTFNDDGDAAIDRVVFTWDSVFFGCEKSTTCRGRVQVQLLESGRIIFGYDGVLTNQAIDDFGGFPGLMPVIAKGGFTQPPGPVIEPPGLDFSEAVPFTGGDLIFEHFTGSPVHFDLDQSNLIFDPNGAGAYNVTSPVDISVATTASPAKVKVGKKATFTSVVTNGGSVAANNILLKDTLPGFAKVKSAAGCTGKTSPVGCVIGTLAPGASATIKIAAKLKETGTVFNRVDVSTTTPGDGHSNNLTEVPVIVKSKGKGK
ncbi:MAG: hypothetical protein QOI10_1723 [Solirubrobacterales bacterium]|nr:hypothetical protein [Solirubrobacterales bacterium]